MKTWRTPASLSASFLAVFALSIFAQQQISSPPEITPESKKRYATAAARVAQDPQYLALVQAVSKAQRAADRLFFEKLRQLEPSLKEYLDYLESTRVAETSVSTGKKEKDPAAGPVR